MPERKLGHPSLFQRDELFQLAAKATVKRRSGMVDIAANRGAIRVAVIAVAWAIAVPGMAVITVSPVAVIPRARADEDAIYEPVRAVVSVWSAGIWVISIVAVGANWSRPNGSGNGTYANAHRDLSMSTTGDSEEQNT